MARRSAARWLVSVGVGMLVVAGTAWAQEERTVEGEVVDPAQYLRTGAHGATVEDVTYDAVDAGQTLALLESSTGTLYLLLASTPGEDPNDLAYDHIGRRVTATGAVYQNGGLTGIVLTAVQPVGGEEAVEIEEVLE